MFHMLVCFDLKPGTEIGQFRDAVTQLGAHLRGLNLAVGVSPVGRRQSDTPLDTDRQRAHEFLSS